MRAGRVARGGILLALALLLGYIESLLPLFPALPGIKLGLSNAALLYALFMLGSGWAWALMGLKVVLSALLFGSPFSGLYALAGGVCSLAAMALLKRGGKASEVGVSVLGAACHNLGQCAVACAFIRPAAVLGMLGVLLLAGLVAGIITGLIARLVIRAVAHRPD